MSVYLLDINLLVALLWTNHEQHGAAIDWFRAQRALEWATCPVTQAGFVRISSNLRIFPDAPSPANALKILEENLRHPRHRFWQDDVSYAEAVAPFGDGLKGCQQVTDAYLFGLAIHYGGTLATFDAAIAALVGTKSGYLKSLHILKV